MGNASGVWIVGWAGVRLCALAVILLREERDGVGSGGDICTMVWREM